MTTLMLTMAHEYSDSMDFIIRSMPRGDWTERVVDIVGELIRMSDISDQQMST